jgi:putative membrane protein
MRFDASERVPELTGLLTVVSLALVFAAVLGVMPRALLPRAAPAVLAAIPHVNAVVSTVAIGTIAGGVAFARRGEYRRHRALMVASLALFAVFLGLYLYKVSIQGPATFPGPESVYRFVYLPVLAVHVLLAIVCVPLLYYVALLGATRPIPEVFGTRHRRVGRVAASLWLVSFLLGNVVDALVYVVYG